MCEKDHKTRVEDINFITYYLILLWRSGARVPNERLFKIQIKINLAFVHDDEKKNQQQVLLAFGLFTL